MQVLKPQVREKILEASLREFRANGYEKAKVRNIAESAGIAVGNVYRYFKSKEQLFYTVTSPAYDEITGFINRNEVPLFDDQKKWNESFEVYVNKIVSIAMEYRDPLLIIIDGSEGTKYQGAKEELIKLAENKIGDALKALISRGDCIIQDLYFAHVLSVCAIEGVLLIIRRYEDNNTIFEMVEIFIGFMFRDFDKRTRKISEIDVYGGISE